MVLRVVYECQKLAEERLPANLTTLQFALDENHEPLGQFGLFLQISF